MPEKKLKINPNAGFYQDVLLCCIPLLIMSYTLYGLRPVLLAIISCGMAYVCDRLLAPLHGSDYRVDEASSECFAVLLTLLMPPNVSAYVLAFGVLSAVVVKEVFGGIGHYPFHPAAVGYAMVAVAWPDEVFKYPAVGKIPITGTGSLTLYQSASATLQSGGLPNLSITQLLVGNYAGPLGTGFTLIILACGIFLLYRKRIRLYTVLPFLLACGLVAWLSPRAGTAAMSAGSLPWQDVAIRLNSLKYEILSGALVFSAVFLISEPVTAPKSRTSQMVYGFLLGFLSMMFRYYGAYETGVCFAILIVNALSDRLDLTVQQLTAARRRKKGKTGGEIPDKKKPAERKAVTERKKTSAAQPKRSKGEKKAVKSREKVPVRPAQDLPASYATLLLPSLKNIPLADDTKEGEAVQSVENLPASYAAMRQPTLKDDPLADEKKEGENRAE